MHYVLIFLKDEVFSLPKKSVIKGLAVKTMWRFVWRLPINTTPKVMGIRSDLT